MNVNELQAGRELDALVAEKVMGCKPKKRHDGWVCTCDDTDHAVQSDNHDIPYLMAYSTDIAAAWEVVEKLHDGPPPLVVIVGGYISAGMGNVPWVCEISNGITGPSQYVKKVEAFAETAPLAICLAALRAI